MSNKIFSIFYKVKTNEYRFYTPWNNDFKTLDYSEYLKVKLKYELMKGYDKSEDIDINLQLYYLDFKKWNDELYKNGLHTYMYGGDTNENNVLRAFKDNSEFNLYNDELIDDIEAQYFDSCNNGYLEWCKEGAYDCYGYDMNAFYPRMLSENKLKIPLKAGYETRLESLDKYNLKYGLYKVVIECYHEDFVKTFKFSENNTYTHYSLIFAYLYQEQYDIKIDLNLTEKYNAYLYNDEDLIESKNIFGNWFNKLMVVKNKHKDNKLVKHLLSSVWGTLCSKNKKKCFAVEENELEKYDEEKYVVDTIDYEKNIYYLTEKEKRPRYKYNIRLMPFLLSYSRSFLGKIAQDNHIKEIIRICCDNITYKSDVIINVPNFLPEDKTTGKFTWKNARVWTKTD